MSLRKQFISFFFQTMYSNYEFSCKNYINRVFSSIFDIFFSSFHSTMQVKFYTTSIPFLPFLYKKPPYTAKSRTKSSKFDPKKKRFRVRTSLDLKHSGITFVKEIGSISRKIEILIAGYLQSDKKISHI